MLVISTQSFTMWLLRATWARGVWKENDYNTRGELTSVDYSDTTPSDSFTYSTDGNLIATSNSKAASVFENTALGIATNETQTVAPYTTTLERGLDAYSRQTSLSVSGEPTQSISFNVENQFSGTQNSDATAVCAYTLDGKYAGRTVCATNGITLLIPVVRDSWRRDLITGTETRDSQSNLLWKSALQYDPLNWLVSRTDNDTDLNTFSYNSCSEVVSASIGGVPYLYAYDDIGNQISNVLGNVSNTFTANAVNQYSVINNTSLTYDLDGNLLSCRCLTYTWDAANRCTSVSSNEVLLLTNEYDTQSRRVRKITPTATHTYFYDGWNLVLEIIDYPDQTQDRISYVWGVDISGTPQGAGGVGGLYWVKYNNVVYIPTYDSNGNIIAYYHGITGNAVATYQYDAFGHTIARSGAMASFFRHRFSTKYFDEETGLYYYGYRFYSPQMGRWLNRDPILEDRDINLYAFCENSPVNNTDMLGMYTLSDANNSLNKKGVRKLKESFWGNYYTDEQVFDEWLALEKSTGSWWTVLPKCPKKICKNPITHSFVNPDSSVWMTPRKMNHWTKPYHPGATYEMRTIAGIIPSGCGNQCTYDERFELITTPPDAGSVDLYGPGEDLDLNHRAHDVNTFNLAKKLGRIPDYYSVRPSWNQ